MRTLTALLTALVLVVVAAGGCKKGKPKAAEIKDIVQITVDDDGFNPDRIPAKRGRPITLVFTRTTDKTCATEVVFASEHIRKELPLNQAVYVPLIPDKTGTIAFACPMNMVKGSLAVIQ